MLWANWKDTYSFIHFMVQCCIWEVYSRMQLIPDLIVFNFIPTEEENASRIVRRNSRGLQSSLVKRISNCGAN